ncbi:MAG: hypothetical protein Q4C66_02175 [Lachnospiraceae bacterium]|nr:hypothetical protein [Lachnospiraceae bacterium]
MNKRKALELLIAYINEYSTDTGFCFHIKFIEELNAIITSHAVGHEKEVFQILIKQFAFVKNLGIRVNEADNNEILSHMGQGSYYYSLHIQDKIVNIRLLMTFSVSGTPLFLGAFFEKAGKRVSDYSQWLPIMDERAKQIGE